jgi:hypothetical protein
MRVNVAKYVKNEPIEDWQCTEDCLIIRTDRDSEIMPITTLPKVDLIDLGHALFGGNIMSNAAEDMTGTDNADAEAVLVVISKVKDYIKAASGMNTSGE